MGNKEQKFYSALRDLFVGARLEGQSGYVNLMNIKTEYFEKIRNLIRQRIEEEFNEDEKNDLFDRLYTFFDSYFSDGGAIFFSSTPVYKNIYAKIYSDREDVSLFWKTRDLYYVKTEVNYQSVKNLVLNEEDLFRFDFDASELQHKKANEKKELCFYFIGLEKKENNYILKFKVKYKEAAKYDRLKEILDIKDTEKLKRYLQENLGNLNHSLIRVLKNGIDLSLLNFKSKTRGSIKAELLITEKETDIFKGVVIEPVVTDIGEIIKYCRENGLLIISEENILKAFRIYKRQNEIDYFIHKDARKFLREQFDLYIYQYLANDLDTIFGQKRLDTVRKIKEIAYYVIELIGKFEDELKKIWLKPKIVRKSNYVITLDRIVDKEGSLELIKKFFESVGIEEQIKEWVELGIVSQDFKKEEVFDGGIFKGLNEKYKHLPIDTKYFSEEIKYDILSLFDNLDDELDGWLIKSDNFQALNTIKEKFKGEVQTIYIDPPFNTGGDFAYIDKFQDSTWLTLIENRLDLAKSFLDPKGTIFIHLDWNANYLGRHLLEKLFLNLTEIVWNTNATKDEEAGLFSYKSFGEKFVRQHDTIFQASKTDDFKFVKLWKPNRKTTNLEIGWLDLISYPNKPNPQKINDYDFFVEKYDDKGDLKLEKLEVKEKIFPIGDIWNDIYSFTQSELRTSENVSYDTQKPENLLRRIIQSTSEKGDIVMDFFGGSGTTIAVSHKLKRKWIGVEVANSFNEFYFDGNERKLGLLGRMKIVLRGDKEFVIANKKRRSHLSKQINWQGGGFFKYYELEQFEDTLRKAVYKPKDDKIENIEFNFDVKLAKDGLEVDYEKESAKYTFEQLYPDVDMSETISNLTGKKIKKITKDKAIFEDDLEIDLNNLTFEEYPFLKPLIWWE
jgi:adenine specific DNA methylase Mod